MVFPKKKSFSIAWHLLLLAASALLIFLTFRNQDFSELADTLEKANLLWAIPVAFGTLLSHYIRAWRWQLLLIPTENKSSILRLFVALNVGYLLNYLIPRSGEAIRAVSLNKLDRTPIGSSLGTIITERLIDLVSLLLASFLAMLMLYSTSEGFFVEQLLSPAFETLKSKLHSLNISLLVVLVLLLSGFGFWLVRRWWLRSNSPLLQRAKKMFLATGSAVLSIKKLRQRGLFLCFTAFIWLGYWLMTYAWFFSFEATEQLSAKSGWILMVVGTLARTLPLQAGSAGAYHLIFANAALLFGVAETYGLALAVLIHGFQTVYHFLIGSTCLAVVLFPHSPKNKKMKLELSN